MLAIFLVVVCAVFRIVPHPPNIAPVGATAVLAGRTMRTGVAIAVTLLAMFLGDVVLAAWHGWPLLGIGTLFVYGGFATQVVLGRALRHLRGGAIAAAVLGAVAFFALSNLGVWLAGGLYPRTVGGLGACYAAALPFLGRSLIGDVLWTVALTLAWRALAEKLARRPRWVSADALESASL